MFWFYWDLQLLKQELGKLYIIEDNLLLNVYQLECYSPKTHFKLAYLTVLDLERPVSLYSIEFTAFIDHLWIKLGASVCK